MKLSKIIGIIITSIGFLWMTSVSEASVSGHSAMLDKAPIRFQSDNREKILRGFLEEYNSPLAPYAKDFVMEADRNNLDWRLVAAIAGVESTFGQQIPANSYNGWGWGIYGDNMIRFASWDEAISTISASLRKDYMNRWGATDVTEIGKFYASDPNWAHKVTYFIGKIDAYEVKSTKKLLSISI